jgi:tetratricopeptide (TPR) repeat protein
MALTFHFQKVARHDEALALAILERAIIAQEPPDRIDSFFDRTQPRNMGAALSSIGRIHAEKSDYTAALAACEEAERFYSADAELRARHGIIAPSEFDRIFHQLDFRSSLFALMADIYRRLGDEQAAVEFNRKAWDHSQRGQDPYYRALDLQDRAKGARERGDFDTALGIYWEVLDLALGSSYSGLMSRDVALALSGVATIYSHLGLHRRALQLYGQSLELNKQIINRERMLDDYRGIAGVQSARGDIDGALASYADALGCCSVPEPDGAATPPGLRWMAPDGTARILVRLDQAWDILLSRARLLCLRDRNAAIEQLRHAIAVIERLRLRVADDDRRTSLQTRFVDAYDLLIDLLYEAFEETGDTALAEALFTAIESAKSRVLAEMLADQPLRRPSEVPQTLLDEETSLLTTIATIERGLASGGTDALADLRVLESTNLALEAVWRRITEADPHEGQEYVALRRGRPLEPNEFRALLQSGSRPICALNYYLTPKRLITVTIYSDRLEIHLHAEPIGRAAAREMFLVRPADPTPPESRIADWEHDFPAVVLDPVRKYLEGYACICLVPHDVLHALPIHALSSADGRMPPLIDEAEVFSIPSASLLRYCLRKPPRARGRDLVLGNPKRTDQIPIPQTLEEARCVAAALGTSALTDVKATRAIVLDRAPDAEHIHIACHNEFYPDDPM